MLKLTSSSCSCNTIQPPQCRLNLSHKPWPTIFPAASRRRATICCTESPRPAAVVSPHSQLANQLRHGNLTEDGLSYKERFIVRVYEARWNNTATVETIANLLQEVGVNHAQCAGYSSDSLSTTYAMRKLDLVWITVRMHIEVNKYPAWSDVVEVETWCQIERRIGTRRDWLLRDYATGEVIGRATSKWVMMNRNTRRLQKVSDEISNEHLDHCPKETRLSFPEEDSTSVKKIPKLEDPAEYSTLRLVPRRADLDMNQHVNNVTYIGWVLESIPQEIIDSYELQTITLDYRRECLHNDVVDSLTSPESPTTEANGSGENRHFLHLLRRSSDGLEINRGRTQWRKKQSHY